MRKLLVMIICLIFCMISIGVCNAETEADDVFNNLAGLYNSELVYLERMQAMWTNLIEAKLDDEKNTLLDHIIYDNVEDFIRISNYFRLTYGFQDENFKIEDAIIPLCDAFGAEKAATLIIQMVFSVDNDEAILSQAKQDIKALKSEDPDSDQVQLLQDLYKAASRIVEYANEEIKDNYTQYSDKISAFRDERRQIKSDCEFDFEWPENAYITQGLPAMENIKAVYKNKNDEEVYKEAVMLAENGHYYMAIDLFSSLNNYKDSQKRKEDLQAYVNKAENLKLTKTETTREKYKKGKFLYATRIIATEVYIYNADGSFRVEYRETGDFPVERTLLFDARGQCVSGTEHSVDSIVTSTKKPDRTIDSSMTYDEYNNLISKTDTYHLPKGDISFTVTHEYRYDEQGRMEYEKVTDEKSSGSVPFECTYSYETDPDGHIIAIEKKVMASGKILSRVEYIYDDLGKIIRKTSYDPNLLEDENGYFLQITKYIYE